MFQEYLAQSKHKLLLSAFQTDHLGGYEGMDLRAKPDVEKRLESVTLTWRSACTKTEGARTTGSKIPRQTEMSTWEIKSKLILKVLRKQYRFDNPSKQQKRVPQTKKSSHPLWVFFFLKQKQKFWKDFLQ